MAHILRDKEKRHCVLQSVHPSPLSAHGGFVSFTTTIITIILPLVKQYPSTLANTNISFSLSTVAMRPLQEDQRVAP